MREKWTAFKTKYGSIIYPFVFFFALLLLDFTFRALHENAGSTGPFHWAPNLFSACWCGIFTAVIYIIPGVAKKIVMSLMLTVFGVFSLVHATLYHVNGSFLSFSDLAFAEDGAAFVSIDYLTFSVWIYFFVFLSVVLGIFAILMAPAKQRYRWLTGGICSVVFAASLTGIILLHSAFYISETVEKFKWTDTYEPGSVEAIYTQFTDPNECLLFCGNYEYLYRSIQKSLEDNSNMTEIRESLDEFYASREETPTPNEMTGKLEGQNVIAILLESIDTWMITEEYMPNLYAIQQQSLNFTNHYTPLFLSAGTFNTEAALNIGFYLPVTGTSAATYATNSYPYSLPNLFRNKGYTANSYHTLDGKYYNRQVVHPQWGYEAFHDQDDLKFTGEPTCDTSLMEEGSYEQIVTHDKPFFSYIITYSGHGPYTEKRQAIAEAHLELAEQIAKDSGVVIEDEDTYNQYVRAIAHVRECDNAIGQLIEKMTADGTIENTAIVFFGDHYSKYLTDTDFIMEMKDVDDMYSICNTPFFIYSNKLEAGNVDKVTCAIDMLPTIANLCNLDYNARYCLGSDAFSDEGGFVCFKDYSWIDSTMLWTPDYEGEMTEEIKARCEEVQTLLNASWDTVKCDYFANLPNNNPVTEE